MKVMLLTLAALALGTRMVMKSGRHAAARGTPAMPGGDRSMPLDGDEAAGTVAAAGGGVQAGLQPGMAAGGWPVPEATASDEASALFPRMAPGGKPTVPDDDIQPGLPDFARGG